MGYQVLFRFLTLTALSTTIACTEVPLTTNLQSYEPITTNYSSISSGIYKSGIIFLADQIERNVDPDEKKRSTVITSFANLDDLSETSAFGRMVGEHLAHELVVRGWIVNDIRLSRDLIINASGEFLLSRDLNRLRSTVPAANIVTGTYTATGNDILLSARVVNFSTGRITSSAETRFKIDGFIANLIYKPRQTPIIKLSN